MIFGINTCENCPKFHSPNGSWNYVKQFWNITRGIYVKYHFKSCYYLYKLNYKPPPSKTLQSRRYFRSLKVETKLKARHLFSHNGGLTNFPRFCSEKNHCWGRLRSICWYMMHVWDVGFLQPKPSPVDCKIWRPNHSAWRLQLISSFTLWCCKERRK